MSAQVYENYPRDEFRRPSVRMHPAWIVLLVLGFIVWWPVGLAILAYTIWSKNMGCHGDRWQNKIARMEEKVSRMRERMGMGGPGMSMGGWPWRPGPSSGNRAFDEYRTETIRRLEDEQREFQDFLQRLRFAKDKAEFDQFMNERRTGGNPTGGNPQAQPSA